METGTGWVTKSEVVADFGIDESALVWHMDVLKTNGQIDFGWQGDPESITPEQVETLRGLIFGSPDQTEPDQTEPDGESELPQETIVVDLTDEQENLAEVQPETEVPQIEENEGLDGDAMPDPEPDPLPTAQSPPVLHGLLVAVREADEGIASAEEQIGELSADIDNLKVVIRWHKETKQAAQASIQRGLNALGANLVEDGEVGSVTLEVLNAKRAELDEAVAFFSSE